jgi:hypothetical protein
MVAAYLARARGSNEPEKSLTRCKNLEQFIREAEAFSLDFGQVLGNEHDQRLFKFRDRLEEILGNVNGYASRSHQCPVMLINGNTGTRS